MKARKVIKGGARKRPRSNAPFDRVRDGYVQKPSLGWVALPAGAPADAFGLRIDGDCLAPRARHGQILVVERVLPKAGEIAVLWFNGAPRPVAKILRGEIHGYPMHPDSECVPLFEVEQLNPPKRYCFRLDKIECIGRVHSVIE